MFRKFADSRIVGLTFIVFVPVGGECFVNVTRGSVYEIWQEVFVPVGGECFVNWFEGKCYAIRFAFSSPLGVNVS